LTAWSSCSGPWRPAASDLAVAPSSTPGSLKSKACPARPRRTSPRHILGPAPLRAFYRVPSGVRVRADHVVLRAATNRAAVLLIETDSKSLIGPKASFCISAHNVLAYTTLSIALNWAVPETARSRIRMLAQGACRLLACPILSIHAYPNSRRPKLDMPATRREDRDSAA
jgi:hypothetical protein